MTQLTKQRWIIDGACGVACLGMWIAAYFIAVRPLAVRADTARVDLETANTRDRQLRAAESARSQAEADLARLETKASQMVVLEPVNRMNDRFATLATMAESMGLTVEQITPSRAVSGSRFVRVPVRLAGRASYDGMTLFIRALHERFPDVAVNALSLNGNPAAPGDSSAYQLELTWFAAWKDPAVRQSTLPTPQP